MALAVPSPTAGSLDGPDDACPRCPRCDYVLANIPEDRCPECGLGYSFFAVEGVEHFVGTVLVRDYQAVVRWSVAGLILAALPLVLARASSPAFVFVAIVAVVMPTMVGLVQALWTFSQGWETPRWVWFSPLIGVLLVVALVFQVLLVLLGLGASGLSGLILLRTANIPEALLPLDSRTGQRLAHWRIAAWAILGLGLLLQATLIARLS